MRAVLAISGVAEVWHVYAVTFFVGVSQAIENPARVSLVAKTVSRSHILNAVTLHSGVRQITLLIGPVIGGFVISIWDAGAAYAVNAVMFSPALVLILLVRVSSTDSAPGMRGFRLGQVVEGFRFVWNQRCLAAVIPHDAMAVLFTNWRILMPIFAVEVLGGDSRRLGFLLAAPAIGRLLGIAIMLMAGNVKRQGLLIAGASLAYAASILLFAISREVLLSWVLIAAVGWTDGTGAIVRNAIVQLVVPGALRGRVTSMSQVFAEGSPALSQVLAGGVALMLGAPGALLLGGAVAAMAAGAAVAWSREVLTYRI